jgi:hypothetical protein
MYRSNWQLAFTVLLVLSIIGMDAEGRPQRALAHQQPSPTGTKSASPEAIKKLIAEMGDKDFQVRERATRALEALGKAALPALKDAATTATDLEIQRRARQVVTRLEGTQAPQVGVQTRVARLLAAKDSPSDRQVVAACYLLTAGRLPRDPEYAAGEKQLAGAKDRLAPAQKLTDALLEGAEFNKDLAGINLRLLTLQGEIQQLELRGALQRLNSDEIQDLIRDVGRKLQAIRALGDEQQQLLAFLLILSRFPSEGEQATLKRERKRFTMDDLVFALMNTREFIVKK